MILLLLAPIAAGLFCLASASRAAWERLNLGAFGIVAVLTIRIALHVSARGPVSAFDGFIRADALSALVLLLTGLVSLACAIYAVGYFRREETAGRVSCVQLRRYYVLTPLFVCAMLLAPIVDNLGVMWLAIEAATLASVLLVTFYNKKASLEAGWKYIIIGSIGVSLALFGTVFVYYAAVGLPGTETRGGMNWSVLMTAADKLNPQAMRLAFILALLGYGT
ncbi:MAG: hydrogenase 4 subunit F, partial [Verrucomicrobia bacterium]|nr:hydrogenase 4 subunit F [Verrucomicrobiota bacterium]